jgi:hypothetical protein
LAQIIEPKTGYLLRYYLLDFFMLRFHNIKVLTVVLVIALFFPAGSAASAEVPCSQPSPESRRQVRVWTSIHHAGELWKAGDESILPPRIEPVSLKKF